MKYIILGLGNFGSSLAQKLTLAGHEVIGVDKQMSKVDALKEKVTHTVCMDTTELESVMSLPLKDSDVVVVGIGEDEGANILTTALMRQLKVKRLISRAISPLHETILEAMNVDEIVHPEEETAERWAKKLNIKGVIDSFEVTGEFNIVEARVPDRYAGLTLAETGISQEYNVVVLTTIRIIDRKNILGSVRHEKVVQGVASSTTRLDPDDIMVLFGNIKNIKRMLKE